MVQIWEEDILEAEDWRKGTDACCVCDLNAIVHMMCLQLAGLLLLQKKAQEALHIVNELLRYAVLWRVFVEIEVIVLFS